MDWASVAGLILALTGVLAGHMLEGGYVGSLVQPAAMSVVLIGTCGAVLLQSGMPAFTRGVRMTRWIFSPPADNTEATSREILGWSATARREGLLSLERYVTDADDPFIRKALRLIVDGIEPTKVREILEIEISGYERRERQAARIWEAAGGYAPTIGILGAVLGLIHVMENLADPSKLGAGIAIAFVSTIYGVGLANLVFLPIANKLKSIIGHQVSKQEMLAELFYSIASGDNPRLLQERLDAYR